MADVWIRGPQGSPSGNSNLLTVASKVIRRKARQRTKSCVGYVKMAADFTVALL